MESSFKKILDLIKRTGDRLVILDSEGETPFVVMGFEDYERILRPHAGIGSLSEGELLDKINRDIAVWRSQQGDGSQPKEQPLPFEDNWYRPFQTGEKEKDSPADFEEEDFLDESGGKKTDERYYFEPVEA